MSMRTMTRPITWLMAVGLIAGVVGGAVAQTHANLRGTFYLMITMTVFGLLGLMLVIGSVRRSTAEAQRLAAQSLIRPLPASPKPRTLS